MAIAQWSRLTYLAPLFSGAMAALYLLPAQAQSLPRTFADNEGIFIDATAFTITLGRAKGDASAQIAGLGARDLGPAAIIFRSGHKVYIAAAPLPANIAARQLDRAVSPVPRDLPVGARGRPNSISIEYVAPKSARFQDLYTLLKNRRVLETMQAILSPFLLPEHVTIKITECGMLNAWYAEENSVKVITVCYELLQHILATLPAARSAAGVSAVDAAAGQFFWLTLHEFGHAIFAIYSVPIMGREEDAADNFATYIILQFGKERARRLVGGAAWAWKEYIDRSSADPQVRIPLAAFSSSHGQPQERFYNLMCIAFGSDPVVFSDLTQNGYLPEQRAQNCKYEYKTLANAFRAEITPHIDAALARQVLDTRWLTNPDSISSTQR